jgi:hypothetical protein
MDTIPGQISKEQLARWRKGKRKGDDDDDPGDLDTFMEEE